MLKLFNLFNIDEKYFAYKKTVKKRFIKVFGGFLLIATAISPFTWMGFLFFLLLLFALGGIFLIEYYSDELDKKYRNEGNSQSKIMVYCFLLFKSGKGVK